MYPALKYRLMLIAATSLALASMIAACAPTYAPHIDAPQIDDSAAVEMDPLRPAPQLPDIDKSLTSCPAGSGSVEWIRSGRRRNCRVDKSLTSVPRIGFVACFTPVQEGVRQRRFTLLHDDRDYCRDAYAKAVKHAAGD